MKRILRTAVLSLAVAATTFAAMPASAGERWHHHRPHKVYRHHDKSGDLLAAGILGAAVGALAVGVLSQPRHRAPVVRHAPYPPEPRYGYDRGYYPAPPRGYRATYSHGAPEPWSRAWYEACSIRYRSFEAESGTYMGFDGRRHFCVIR